MSKCVLGDFPISVTHYVNKPKIPYGKIFKCIIYTAGGKFESVWKKIKVFPRNRACFTKYEIKAGRRKFYKATNIFRLAIGLYSIKLWTFKDGGDQVKKMDDRIGRLIQIAEHLWSFK